MRCEMRFKMKRIWLLIRSGMIITSISGQDYEKRQKILKIKNNSEIKRAVNSSLFLEYKCLNQERNSKDFSDNTTFIISKNQYEYKNLKGESIKEFKDLCKGELIFGRETNEFKPEINFHKDDLTINNKQFQISTTKLSKNFFLNDLAIGNETYLLVESKRYLLHKYLMLKINKIVYEVSNLYPPLNEIQMSDKYFIIDKSSINNNYMIMVQDVNKKHFLKLQSKDESYPDITLDTVQKNEYSFGSLKGRR